MTHHTGLLFHAAIHPRRIAAGQQTIQIVGFSSVVHQAKDAAVIAEQELIDLSQKEYRPQSQTASQAAQEPVATDGSEPVGSVELLSARSPAGFMRLQRIRPLEHLISSSVLELRWQQALPLDRGVDHFGSAFFTLENPADKVGSARAIQHSIPLRETHSCRLDICSPFLLDQSLLKMSFLIGCTK